MANDLEVKEAPQVEQAPVAVEQPDVMTLGDFLSAPKTDPVDKDVMSIDEFMGLPEPIPPFELAGADEETQSNAVVSLGKSMYLGALSGAATYNDFLGAAASTLIPGFDKYFPEFDKTFGSEPLEPTTERLEKETQPKNLGQKWANDWMKAMGGLGVSLPLDVLTGGAAKITMTGTTIPVVANILSRIPNFAFGAGIKNLFIAANKAEEQGKNPVAAAYEGVVSGLESTAINTLFGSAGKGAKGFLAIEAISVGNVYYEAAKEGRYPSQEELASGVAEGFGYGIMFTVLPALKEASEVKAEKSAIGKHLNIIEGHAKKGNFKKADVAVKEMMKDPNIRPEVKEAAQLILENKRVDNVLVQANFERDYLRLLRKANTLASTLEPMRRLRDRTGGLREEVATTEREVKRLLGEAETLRADFVAKREKGEKLKTAKEIALEKAGVKEPTTPVKAGVKEPTTPVEEAKQPVEAKPEPKKGIVEPVKEVIGKDGKPVKVVEKAPKKKPREPVEPNIPGEKKEAGLAKRLELEAIKAGIIKDMGEKAEFVNINHADQAKRGLELYGTDQARAERIAKGLEQAPGDLHNLAVYNVVKHKAIASGDAALIRDLGVSAVVKEASLAGQTLGLVENRNPLDPVENIADVANKREKMTLKRAGVKTVKEGKEKGLKETKKVIKKAIPKKKSWETFMRSIQC